MIQDIIYIDTEKTRCDGGKDSLGHPRVFLAIPKDGNEITCPYCSKKFVLKKTK
jgi:uncharacterized Zn-finger protein